MPSRADIKQIKNFAGWAAVYLLRCPACPAPPGHLPPRAAPPASALRAWICPLLPAPTAAVAGCLPPACACKAWPGVARSTPGAAATQARMGRPASWPGGGLDGRLGCAERSQRRALNPDEGGPGLGACARLPNLARRAHGRAADGAWRPANKRTSRFGLDIPRPPACAA